MVDLLVGVILVILFLPPALNIFIWFINDVLGCTWIGDPRPKHKRSEYIEKMRLKEEAKQKRLEAERVYHKAQLEKITSHPLYTRVSKVFKSSGWWDV